MDSVRIYTRDWRDVTVGRALVRQAAISCVRRYWCWALPSVKELRHSFTSLAKQSNRLACCSGAVHYCPQHTGGGWILMAEFQTCVMVVLLSTAVILACSDVLVVLVVSCYVVPFTAPVLLLEMCVVCNRCAWERGESKLWEGCVWERDYLYKEQILYFNTAKYQF
jgi:hypothetical protein